MPVRIFRRMFFRAIAFALLISIAYVPVTHADQHARMQGSSRASAGDEYVTAAAQLVHEALSHLGIPYRFGGTSPETGLDCSGLVLNVFRNAVGLDLPRTARQMAGLGDKISRSDLQPGDLVFFNTMRRTFSHVGIYLGDGKLVHAPSRGGKVRVESIGTRYWAKRFNGARRLIDEPTLGNASSALLTAR